MLANFSRSHQETLPNIDTDYHLIVAIIEPEVKLMVLTMGPSAHFRASLCLPGALLRG